nr:hypothetical protein Iba_chr12eCG7150 [Ipomoea batatas]
MSHPAPPPLTPAVAPALVPRALTPPPRALLGCTNVFDEFEASKEQVSELEKRLALD